MLKISNGFSNDFGMKIACACFVFFVSCSSFSSERCGGLFKSSVPSAQIDSIKVVAADRERWPNHSEDAIRGSKFIENQDVEYLYSMILFLSQGNPQAFNRFLLNFNDSTNPRWVGGRIVDFLYEVDRIAEPEADAFGGLF